MVYGIITIVTGAYKPTNITGGPHIVDLLLGEFHMITLEEKPRIHVHMVFLQFFLPSHCAGVALSSETRITW